MSVNIQGRYYNGVSAQASAAQLVVELDGQVHLQPAQAGTSGHLRELTVDSRISGLPMTLRFPAGGKFETTDCDTLEACLRVHGGRDSWLHRLESRWHSVASAVVLVFAIIGAGYVWGIPLLSDWLAPRIPRQVELGLGEEVMQQLDDLVFEPSGLSAQRQRDLQALFNSVRQPFPDLASSPLHLRKGGLISANAFALPGGAVVLTDELVNLATSDEQLMAVLLHELGHVRNRHTMRQVLSQSGVAVITLLVFGDVSGLGSVVVAVPTMMMQSAFSRDMELEADDFAIASLQQRQIPLSAFGDLLMRLEGFHTRCREVLREARRNKTSPSSIEIESCLQQGTSQDTATGDDEEDSWTSYLSTHPATQQRIERLNR